VALFTTFETKALPFHYIKFRRRLFYFLDISEMFDFPNTSGGVKKLGGPISVVESREVVTKKGQ
jgi:hypothetical protein